MTTETTWLVHEHPPAVTDRLLFNLVVPRPIALVTTVSPGGVVNAAPYAFSGAVATGPPMVYISPGLRNGSLKDTAANAIRTGEFVVHVVTEDLLRPVLRAARALPPEESEIDEAPFAVTASSSVSVPRLRDAVASFECKLWRVIDLPGGRPLIVGTVTCFHVDDDVLVEGTVDSVRLGALGRLGDAWFCRTGDAFVAEFPKNL